MGNSSSSSGRGHGEESVDFGFLIPQGVYTGPRDWNQSIVSQLICQRRLAPFYRPLEDYEESWDDDQILAHRKELPLPDGADGTEAPVRPDPLPSHISRHSHSKRPSNLKEPSKPEAAVYRGAVECPICFLVRISHPHTYFAAIFVVLLTINDIHAVLSAKHEPF
jgi:hypothetical protein